MDTLGPHHLSKLYQKWPPDGGDIEYARYFWIGHAAHEPETDGAGS